MGRRTKDLSRATTSDSKVDLLARCVTEAELASARAQGILDNALTARSSIDPLVDDAKLDDLDATVTAAAKAADRARARVEAHRHRHNEALAAECEEARAARRKAIYAQVGKLELELPQRWYELAAEIDTIRAIVAEHEAQVAAVNAERSPEENEIVDALTSLLRQSSRAEIVLTDEPVERWVREGSAIPLDPAVERYIRKSGSHEGHLEGDPEQPVRLRRFRRNLVRPLVSAAEAYNPFGGLSTIDTSLRFQPPADVPDLPLVERFNLVRTENDEK